MGQAVTKQDTYTGNVVSFTNNGGAEIDSLSVPIQPTQNFNGYTKPWAGGAGKNLLQLTGRTAVTTGNIINTTPRDFSAPYAYIGITMNNYFNNGNISSYSITDKSVSLTSAQKGYGIGLNVGVSPETTYTFSYKNKASSFAGVGYYDIDGNYLSYKQFTTGTWSFTTPANCVNLMVILLPNANIDTLYDEPQLELGSLESSWVPYENICPISGLTGLSVYVSPTQDKQDATTYAEDWTSQAGTVYAGSIEVVSGSLKARPQYASYNGETLVGPWLSSMDEYVAGTTPTTGAQVVDLGGTETTYTLTAQTIAALSGANNVWASNNATIKVVVDILAGFKGWLIKCVTNGTPVEIPLKYIRAETYTVTPDQRMELIAERDVNGILHRETVPNTPPKIEFNTPLMTNSDIEALNTIIRNAFTNVLGRDITIQYYNPEQNAYWEWDCYMPDVHYQIRNVDVANNVINYEELRYAFIGY